MAFRFWLFAPCALLGLAACSRLLDFSEVTGGKMDAGGISDAATDGDATVSCTGGESNCGGECVDLATDPDHCGACNADCGGGECKASKCAPYLVASLEGCHGVVVDDVGSFAYVTRYRLGAETAAGGVYRVDLQTGEATGLTLGQAGAVWITRAGDRLFWTTEHSDASSPPRAVWKLDLNSGGTTATQLYPNAGDTTERRPFGLAVAGAFVYFADKNGAIGRVPIDGDTSELLYPNLPGGALNLDVLGQWIYYTELNSAPNTDAVRRVPLTPATPPGQPEDVLPGLEGVWGVVARDLPTPDGGVLPSVFASIVNGAVIARGTPTGGFSTTTVGNQAGTFANSGAGIALIDDRLYWATRYDIGGSIQTYQLGAIGNATEFASTKQPVGVTHAGEFLYWCSLKEGLLRVRL